MLHSLAGPAPIADEARTTVVCLGKYDPKQFSIFYALHVADKNCEFLCRPDDFNVFQYVIGQYRVVILWSYIHLPAFPGGIWSHVPTVKEEILNDGEIRTQKHYIEGLDEPASIFLFKTARYNTQMALVRHIKHRHPELEYHVGFFLQSIKANLGYYREARTDTEEHRKIVAYSKRVYGFPLG